MSVSGWIGVDLDGTIARYDGWQGITHVGEPIAPMVERVKQWLAEGVAVKIFTARVYDHLDDPVLQEQIRAPIVAWCIQHIGQELPITCCKDFGMIELWDDRCVSVKINTGEIGITGPTGQFPQGKLRDDDKGGLRIAVAHLDGTVVVSFGCPCEWIGLDKATALQLAGSIETHARQL